MLNSTKIAFILHFSKKIVISFITLYITTFLWYNVNVIHKSSFKGSYSMFKNSIKKFFIFFIITLLILTGCSCSSKSNYNVTELSEEILSLTSFSEMKSLSGTSLPSYFIFQDGDVKRFNVMISASNESSDTLACFEVIDEKQRSLVVSGISGYLTNQSNSFKSTIEKEYNKVQNRLLVELGSIIILVVCNDTTPVWDYLTELGAKEVV